MQQQKKHHNIRNKTIQILLRLNISQYKILTWKNNTLKEEKVPQLQQTQQNKTQCNTNQHSKANNK